ncbi:MAG: hypothetical protein WCK86_13100, partial [Planctomycetia bacterium]
PVMAPVMAARWVAPVMSPKKTGWVAPLTDSTFDGQVRRLRSEILDALHNGSLCDKPQTAETCRHRNNECFRLFVFVNDKGV